MQNMHYNMSYYMHYMPNNMQNMQNDNMQNNMQFNMHNMQAICRFGADCLVLTVICRICQIICSICRICWGDFQYAQYALPTLLMQTRGRFRPQWWPIPGDSESVRSDNPPAGLVNGAGRRSASPGRILCWYQVAGAGIIESESAVAAGRAELN